METLRLDICPDFAVIKAEALIWAAKSEKVNAGFEAEQHIGWTNTSVYSPGSDRRYLPAFSHYIESLGIEIITARLMILEVGGVIKKHTDAFLKNDIARLHLPIQTNAGAKLYIDGKDASWPEGELWFGDFRLPHWGENTGNLERIHLVIDVAVKDSFRHMFGSAASKVFGSRETGLEDNAKRYSCNFILPAGLSINGIFDSPLTRDMVVSIRNFHSKLYLFIENSPFLAVSIVSENRLSIDGLPLSLILESDFESSNPSLVLLKLDDGRSIYLNSAQCTGLA